MADYCVILDQERGYCRLFRSSSEKIPAGEMLWQGEGLRRGYDQMIRLNKERKPNTAYSVISSLNKKGRRIFNIVTCEPSEAFEVHAVFYNDWKAACAEKARLVRERNELERAQKEELRAILERVGLPQRRKPKFTEADMRYIGWLKETGRLAA